MNLAGLLVATARRHPERAALRLGEAVTTYAELDEATGRVAGLLASRGIGPGDRVALVMPNVPAFPVVYAGILRAGAVVVPLNPLLKARETTHCLSDCGAAAVVVQADIAEASRAGAAAAGAQCLELSADGALPAAPPVLDVVPRDDDDTAVMIYTAATDGRSKAAELRHRNVRRNAEVFAGDTLARLTPDDVVLGALPLFHAFGATCAMNATLLSGAALTLLPRFHPGRALQTIERDRVTVFEGVPAMFAALLHHPDRGSYDTSSLRLCISGGAALPVEVLHGFDAAYGVPLLEGYGLSETSPVASFNHPERGRKPGSIGTPLAEVTMRAVDGDGRDVPVGEVGEVVIGGHGVMKGYYRQPAATDAVLRDGELRTGDLARVDEDGYFFLTGRSKELVIRGGFNVYPREIELVLLEHPQVVQAAVFGVPDERMGEEIAALVVLAPGATATAGQLRDHVKAEVAGYKYPRVVRVVAALPTDADGAVVKAALPALLAAG